MAIRTQEQLFAFSFRAQDNAQTYTPAASMWRLNKLNPELPFPQLKTEDDAAEMGKGDEFATTEYATNWDGNGSIKKYLSSQFAQWLFSFGLGAWTNSNAYSSVIVPQDPQIEGIELPYFSVLQQFRPNQSGGAAMDQLIGGCAIEDFTIELNSGPGRQNSQVTVNFVSTGQFQEPSGYTMPSLTPEVLLPASSATINISGVDYVANKNLMSLTFTGKNNLNLNDGFYIGSGFQSAGNQKSGAIRGRLEFGNRQYGLSFVTRLRKTSDEFAQLKQLTSGSATITLSGGAQDSMTINCPSINYSAMTLTDSNNIATLRVDVTLKKDPNQGILNVSCQNSTVGGIGSAA